MRCAGVTTARYLLPWGIALGAIFAATAVEAREAGATALHAPAELSRAASSPAELEVSFEEAAVVAADLTPGGDAVFVAVVREPRGHVTRVARFAGLEVVDALGEARFAPEGGAVPLKSVWAVVDLATGAAAVAAPAGFRLRQVPFPGRAFEVGAPGLVNRLRHRFAFVDVLLVRPGVGAWWLTAWDTGPADRDGRDDDATVTATEDMEPLGASPPPPESFAAGDVIVVVDPRDLAFYWTRLLGPPAAEAALGEASGAEALARSRAGRRRPPSRSGAGRGELAGPRAFGGGR